MLDPAALDEFRREHVAGKEKRAVFRKIPRDSGKLLGAPGAGRPVLVRPRRWQTPTTLLAVPGRVETKSYN